LANTSLLSAGLSPVFLYDGESALDKICDENSITIVMIMAER